MILDPDNGKWNNSNHVPSRLAGFPSSLCTVQLSLPSKMYISGLPHHYIAAQLHFHWGSANKPGAEHTLDGEQAVAEVNIAIRVFLFVFFFNSLEWVYWKIAFQTHVKLDMKRRDCVEKQQLKQTVQNHIKINNKCMKGKSKRNVLATFFNVAALFFFFSCLN